MQNMLINLVINTIAIILAIKFVPGIAYSGQWWGVLLVSMIFGLVNAGIRPLVKLFTFPLLILSLGLFTFVINAMMLSLTAWISGQFDLGFSVAGFRPAFWGALVISLSSMLISCLMPAEEKQIT
jgi:putative membrane protein